MSIGRKHQPDRDARDIEGDYLNALIAEYETYQEHGLEKATDVALALRQLGHEVRPHRPTPGQKERAVGSEPVERAVEGVSPKRGRPARKTV